MYEITVLGLTIQYMNYDILVAIPTMVMLVIEFQYMIVAPHGSHYSFERKKRYPHVQVSNAIHWMLDRYEEYLDWKRQKLNQLQALKNRWVDTGTTLYYTNIHRLGYRFETSVTVEKPDTPSYHSV